jgi:rare lipoprotein A (peptidoglycan hydrolase)
MTPHDALRDTMIRQHYDTNKRLRALSRFVRAPKRAITGLGAGLSVAVLAGIFGMQDGKIDTAGAMQYAMVRPGIVVLSEDKASNSASEEKLDIETTEVDRGVASFYGSEFEGRPTASGEVFDPTEHTAAHPSLPFGTQLQVTNQRNGRSVIVRVNDRGPFTGGRVIDLSKAAAREIGMVQSGTVPVVVEIVTEN